MDIAVTLATPEQKRRKPADDSTPGIGKVFSDHLFLRRHRKDAGWHDTRMNRSASRLCMPELPGEDALAAVSALLRVDREGGPGSRGTSLYIRATMIATEAALGVRSSSEYLFFIITGSVGSGYARGLEPVRIPVEETQVRAAKGGLGVARDSVLRIARNWGWAVSERRADMTELRRAFADGTLREVFGTGTAAVISPVGAFPYRGEIFVVDGGGSGAVSRKLIAEITGIQYGEIEDRYGWVYRVE